MVCYHGLPYEKKYKSYLAARSGFSGNIKLGFFTTKDVVLYVYIIDSDVHSPTTVVSP